MRGNLNLRLRYLSTAMCVAAILSGPMSSASESGESKTCRSSELNITVQGLRNAIQSVDRGSNDDAIRKMRDQTEAAIKEIDRVVASQQCLDYPAVYIHGIDGQILSSVDLQICGTYGGHILSFVSGIHLSSIITAVNSLGWSTGVFASAPVEDWVALRSYFVGQNAFAVVDQLAGKVPIVGRYPGDANLAHQITTYGCSVAEPNCFSPATIYFDTGPVLEAVSPVGLELTGNYGTARFAFDPGTEQKQIIDEINSATRLLTGIVASQAIDNPDLIVLRTVVVGRESRIFAYQHGPPPYRLQDWHHVGVSNMGAHGQSAIHGDADCDYSVGVSDLILVIQRWGECPMPDFHCSGDVTNDGSVNSNDLLSVIDNWGQMNWTVP